MNLPILVNKSILTSSWISGTDQPMKNTQVPGHQYILNTNTSTCQTINTLAIGWFLYNLTMCAAYSDLTAMRWKGTEQCSLICFNTWFFFNISSEPMHCVFSSTCKALAAASPWWPTWGPVDWSPVLTLVQSGTSQRWRCRKRVFWLCLQRLWVKKHNFFWKTKCVQCIAGQRHSMWEMRTHQSRQLM